MHETGCKPCPLVTTESCDIWCCTDCGAVHINLGAVSLRLKESHFKSVDQAFRIASRKLEDMKSMPGEQHGPAARGMKTH